MSKKQLLIPLIISAILPPTFAQADDWPQWRGPGRDGVWRESGILEQFSGPEIPIRWKADIAGGYSGPTVADGRVLVTDHVDDPEERERVHCFRWTDGSKLWTHEYPCDYGRLSYRTGPRASVTLDQGRAYALGSLGHLVCLDAATGTLLWKKDPQVDLKVKMPIWGVAAAPVIEGELLIVQIGDDGGCIVAMDKQTGEVRWKALDDPASYCAPIVVDQAGRRVLVCRTGTRVVGLDVTDGTLLWAHEIGHGRWPIAIATPVVHGDRLLLGAVDKGSLLLRLRQDQPAIEKLWWRFGPDEKHTDSLQPLIGTPVMDERHIYGASLYGLFRCIDAKTGDRVWVDETVTSRLRWGTVHMVRNGDKHWIFNDRGELIICRLSPKGYDEISRTKLIGTTTGQLPRRDGVTWSHPAFAYQHVFARNDKELVCASLMADDR